jgi:Sec1 family
MYMLITHGLHTCMYQLQMLQLNKQGQMNAFVAGANDWRFHGQDSGSDRGRSTLLLIDRADDPLSPLMHEFTYQVLVTIHV